VLWAVRFPEVIDGLVQLGPPRHPSQLYEAILEGLLLFAILSLMFWKTRARYQPGLLVGAFVLGYGLFRFLVEFVREPDAHLVEFAQNTGLSMGQWLCVPMILGGLYLIVTSFGRRQRIEPIAGQESVA
jgi:phosphatidylglycerol:prolipoprotein diacylglycerol transferase